MFYNVGVQYKLNSFFTYIIESKVICTFLLKMLSPQMMHNHQAACKLCNEVCMLQSTKACSHKMFFICLYFCSKRFMLSHRNHLYFILKYYTTLDVHQTCKGSVMQASRELQELCF